ncbi:hypothetical protein GCM10023191_033470 [Actinoallomurus oryzae]|uniref:Uncharacterized protein n=1 Tax=Actinoallomurus oryzae TaxID=502180 RepID=A0ABP8PWP5_9ACTN
MDDAAAGATRTAGEPGTPPEAGRRIVARFGWVRRRPGLVAVLALAFVTAVAVVSVRAVRARYATAGATFPQVAYKAGPVSESGGEATTNGAWWYGASVTGDHDDDLHVYGYRYSDGRSWQTGIKLPHDSDISSLNAGSGTLAVHIGTNATPTRQFMLDGTTGRQAWNYDACDRHTFASRGCCRTRCCAPTIGPARPGSSTGARAGCAGRERRPVARSPRSCRTT